MSVTRILDGLEDSPATGQEADAAARMGLLEWVFAGSGVATPQAARDALAQPAAQNPRSPAARAFVAFLEQACHGLPSGPRRRGRNRILQ